MHIAIDARMYGTAQRGIGRYLMKLIEGLEEISPSPPIPLPRGEGGRRPGEGNTFTIFLRKENFEEYQSKNPRFKKAVWDAPWYGLREQLTTSYVLRTNPDLVHFPHWNVPLFFNRPFMVTIHDLILFHTSRIRGVTTRNRLAYMLRLTGFRYVFRHAVLASRAIIVPSDAVREQLLDRYPQVIKKVRVIYESPTITPSRHSERRSEESHTFPRAGAEIATPLLGVGARNDIDGKYVLYVGAAYPHKNLPRLLEAWKVVRKEFPDHKLVLVGREDFFWKKLKSTSYVLGSTSSIVFYGPASDAELAALYKNAVLLVQPSLEEGFSLSPLEALSFGCPVAVSDIPVHREILGNVACYFDPHNVSDIASALISVLTAPNLKTKAQSAGSTLLARYSWYSHAEKTLALYYTAIL